MLTRRILTAGILGFVVVLGQGMLSPLAQTQSQAPPAGGRPAGPPPPDPKKPHKLELTTPTSARYKVTEQLAGISFPSDAVGTTAAITGAIIVNPDGTIG